jgi:AhpD family alkylhydroperoxidase
MSTRYNLRKALPAGFEAMLALEKALEGGSLETGLQDLLKLRASQINGCAFCVDMHARDARVHGESERRVAGVAAFEESPQFTEREKAALAWVESLTRIERTHAPEDVYQRVRAQFDDRGIAELSLLAAAINAWNRLAISARTPPAGEWPTLK